MPRPPRILAPDVVYHVTCRGNRKQPIFVETNDRVFFLKWMNRVMLEAEVEVFTYVLMTNHLHFLARTPEANLSHTMQRLTGVYGQFVNHSHELTGHVFQGRFHSRIVETDAQFLACARYDDLNPVRAGIVDHPLEWRWSSCRTVLGLEAKPDFLRPEWLHDHFGPDLDRARQGYLAFLEDGLELKRVA